MPSPEVNMDGWPAGVLVVWPKMDWVFGTEVVPNCLRQAN